jgi:hypothetical protein
MRLDRIRVHLLTALATMFLAGAFATGATAQVTDTDGDTMPDDWETFFGLDPNDGADAAGDLDGDGLTNAQEYAAGRHPVGRFARYFAEGSTGFFDTTVAVLNMSATDTAHVSLALLRESGGVTTHRVTLAPRGRQSVSLNAVLGTSAAVSIIVESDVAVAADRTMTWGTTGVGLSLDSGAPSPATTWYFAEGATGPFLLYYLFENPGDTPANVTVLYLREGGTPVSRPRMLPPHSRTTVFVNGDDPGLANTSLGAIVTSDVPILAERAMYAMANGTFAGGSASSASPALATQWYFGEGATGPFFHAFLSLLNPGSTAATATVTYHMSDGSTASKPYPVPAQGRRTVYFNGEAASDPSLASLATGAVWFTVSSTQPIVGERAMWWSTWPWYEGHAAAGSTTSDVVWGIAEGREGGPAFDQTYVLVGNAATTAGQVRITLVPDGAATATRDLPIAAGGRLTLNMGSLFGLSAETRFSVLVESLGATPVPLVVDYARYRSPGSLPFSGGGAAPGVPLTQTDAAPGVTSTQPANGAQAGLAANLTITFSEPVDVTGNWFQIACATSGVRTVADTVVTGGPTVFTIDPNADFAAGEACTVTVTAAQVTDQDAVDPPDTMAADRVFTFTADAAPAVTTTAPANGATGVALTSTISLFFSEPVTVTGNWFQIVCGTSGTRNVADTVVTGGSSTYTINPNTDFAEGEACTVTLFAAQIADQDAADPPDTLAANHVFSFSTVDTAPAVASTSPAIGETVGTTANLSVTFTEPVNVTGNWFQIVCTVSGTRNVADTVVTGGPTTFTANLNLDFVPGESCTATIFAALVTDQDGVDPPDAMTANFVGTFSVTP